jgi:Tn3 transposase DDE domain
MCPHGAGPPASGPRHRGRAPGHATASLLSAGLHASIRRSALATALPEYGRLVRTVCICRYVAGEELRRRVCRQLNRGESRRPVRRPSGPYVRRRLSDQTDQTPCLTLVTSAGVLCTTAYPGDALDQPLNRGHGRGRGGGVVRDESQPLDPSDGTVPGPVVNQAKAEEVSPAAGPRTSTRRAPIIRFQKWLICVQLGGRPTQH